MKITVPGIPIPQARMRYANRGGFVRIYDPNAKQKMLIKTILSSYQPSSLPCFPRVSFLFYMPIPKDIPKKLKKLYESGTLKHTKKPDVDNLAKLYLDCMEGIFFKGDQSISLGGCLKIYGKDPKTLIFIKETQGIFQPREADIWLKEDILVD